MTPVRRRVSLALRTALGVALLAGLYLLVAGLTLLWLALAVLAVWLLGDPAPGTTRNGQPIAMVAALFVALVAILREVARISEPDGPAPDSVSVRPAEAPLLWAEVRRLAALAGTEPPVDIRLTTEVNAGVTEESRLLGLRPGFRRLYLGAPLLVALRPAELRAVLVHELGHYAHRHSRFSEPAYRGSAALHGARLRIREAMAVNTGVRMYAGLFDLALAGYARLFDRVTLPVRRRQELEADRMAAEIAGPGAVAAALRTVPAVAVLWGRYQQECLLPMSRAGRAPDDPFRAFECLLATPDGTALLAEIGAAAAALPADRHDSHPSLAVRLDRLSALDAGTGTGAGAGTGSERYVDIAPARWAVAGRTSHGGRRAASVPWRDWLAALAGHRADQALVPLAAAVRAADDGAEEVTLDTVLGLLTAGRGRSLARSHAREVDPHRPDGGGADGARGLLVAAVRTAIGQALVRAGRATWASRWPAPDRLVAEAVTAEELDDLVAAAVDGPGEAGRLRLHLAALGVDPAAAPIRAGGTPVIDRPELSGGTREHRRATGYTALTMALVLTLIAGVVWVGTGGSRKPAYPRTPFPDYRTYPAYPTYPTYGPLLPADPLGSQLRSALNVPVVPSFPTEVIPLPTRFVPLTP
jgi:Zn-dependent protease with chaperone function